jgi:hypothetical protein
MQSEKILLPLNVMRCPLEIFSLVNGCASRSRAPVTLLHVVNLNILAPELRVYDELTREARWYLKRLAGQYLHPGISTLIRVRIGKPAEEILAEAREQNVDLIILPTFGPSFWTRLRSLWKSASAPIVCPIGSRIIRDATCGVFVAVGKTRFNCERAWGRPRGIRCGAEYG